MGRPRLFDKEEVLLSVMKLFLHRGYEATSMSDVMRDTGLSKSSLYAAFGNKRELFLSALDIYQQRRVHILSEYLNSQSAAMDSLIYFFDLIMDNTKNGRDIFGCMSCQEVAEMLPHDDEIRGLIERDFSGVENEFYLLIKRGMLDGSIPKGKDARFFARHITVAHHGYMVISRSKTDIKRLEESMRFIIDMILL